MGVRLRCGFGDLQDWVALGENLAEWLFSYASTRLSIAERDANKHFFSIRFLYDKDLKKLREI